MMAFDLELARQLLLQFQHGSKDMRKANSTPPGVERHVAAYHVEKLVEGGYVKAQIVIKADRGTRRATDFIFQDITFKGHEFIATFSSETVWAKLKKTFADKSAQLPMDLLLESGKQILLKHFL